MNKHLLSTIAAAMLPIGVSSASIQSVGGYSYIGNRHSSNNTYLTSPNKSHKHPQQTTHHNRLALKQVKPVNALSSSSLKQTLMPDIELSLSTAGNRKVMQSTDSKVLEHSVNSPALQLVNQHQINELIIIDGAVPDKHLFYQQLKPGTDIVEIDSQHSGLSQLKEILSGYSELSALHLVSHATDGVILLGDSRIDEQLLKDEVKTLAAIDNALKDGADVLIYGCDLAKGDSGQQLLETIAHSAYVDVAASDDLTGSNNKNADWDLEIKIGDIDSSRVFSERSLLDFTETLAVTEHTSLAIYTHNSDNYLNQSSLATSDGNFIAINMGGDITVAFVNSIGYLYASASTGLFGKTLQVAADGTNTETFKLDSLKLNVGKRPIQCSANGRTATASVDVTVEGYYSNGSSAGAQNATINTALNFCGGNDVDIVDVSSTFGAGKDLSHFVVKYNGTAPADKYFTITSFSTISVDTLAPVISQITAVNTPTNVTTPSYTFTANEAGTLAVGGSCGSASEGAVSAGNVTIAFTLTDNSTALTA
ncbi:MAG: hypothetical protein ACJASU_002617, partial [Cognaticolwellia sp.]